MVNAKTCGKCVVMCHMDVINTYSIVNISPYKVHLQQMVRGTMKHNIKSISINQYLFQTAYITLSHSRYKKDMDTV